MASPFLQDRGLPNYTGSPRLYIVGLGCSKLEKMAKHISPFEKRIRRRDVGIVGQELKISRIPFCATFASHAFHVCSASLFLELVDLASFCRRSVSLPTSTTDRFRRGRVRRHRLLARSVFAGQAEVRLGLCSIVAALGH